MADQPQTRNGSETNRPGSEAWQLAKIEAGIAELEFGKGVRYEKVSEWLKSWGRPGESVAPRST